MGANQVGKSTHPKALKAIAGSLDVIISTVSADLDWGVYIEALQPKGRLHFVGVSPSPISTHVFPLIAGQKSISATPLGSPATTAIMLDFTRSQASNPSSKRTHPARSTKRWITFAMGNLATASY